MFTDYNAQHYSERHVTLKDSVICISAMKIGNAAFYVGLFFLAFWYADGTWRTILSVLTLCAVPIVLFCGVILFYGAYYENILALKVAVWLCIALATYNTVFGIMGFVYFLLKALKSKHTVHFVASILFLLIAISLFGILFHDLVVIYTLKKALSLRSSRLPVS